MILITGATGHLGSATIRHLLASEQPQRIAALVRDKQKAQTQFPANVELREGHYDDVSALQEAMKGIESVLLISGRDAHRLQQHTNVIEAAKSSGVKRLVYTSVSMVDVEHSAMGDFMDNHFQTEERIRQSGIPYTMLRNTLYAEVLPMFFGPQVMQQGIYLPGGDGGVPYALRDELAEAAAVVLREPGHENKTYELTGTKTYLFSELAAFLSTLSGKPVPYVSPEPAAFAETMRQAGLPEYVIRLSQGFGIDIGQKRYANVHSDLGRLIGREPSSIEAYLKGLYA